MDDNISNLMKMERPVEAFIEEYANSFIKWEAIQFFHDHPKTAFKLEELAQTLNRPGKPLKKELQELSQAGLLKEEKSGKTIILTYAPGPTPAEEELRNTMERFIRLCQDREGRLRVIYKLLKNGKPIQG